MKLLAEISLYPLTQDFLEPIGEFIERLNAHKAQYPDLEVKTSATNTLVKGKYATVLNVVGHEMERTHAKVGQAIFVCKFLNGTDIDIYRYDKPES